MGALLGVLRRGTAPPAQAAPWAQSLSGFQESTRTEGRFVATHLSVGEPPSPPLTDGELTIVADARLDDRATLVATLCPESGEESDEQLLLRAYRKWGPSTPAHLLGDFAFAIWDSARQCLFCARDAIGVRQFYYGTAADQLWFSSDLSVLLSVPEILEQPNPAYVASYLLDPHFDHPEATFCKDVQKLPAAHSLQLARGSFDLRRYWDPADVPEVRFGDQRSYSQALNETLRVAVRDRLRVAGDVGVHVTGGLDSSGIAALARELASGRPLRGYCWEPPPEADCPTDERARIVDVARQNQIPLSFQTLQPDDLVAVLERDIVRSPTVDTLVHEQHVQRQAQGDGVRHLLSGWGGDELIGFNGRGYWAQLWLHGRWVELFKSCRSRSQRPWRYLLRRAIWPTLPGWLRSAVSAGWSGFSRSPLPLDFTLAQQRASLRTMARSLRGPTWKEVGVRRTQLQLLARGHLHRRMEAWGSSGLRRGVTYSYPLLDRRVVEFALGVPAEQFVTADTTRYLLRESLAGLVPEQVRLNRDKSDPARLAMLNAATPAAYRAIAARLRQYPFGAARSKYLDVGRLVDRLEAGDALADSESYAIWHAVQFLDF